MEIQDTRNSTNYLLLRLSISSLVTWKKMTLLVLIWQKNIYTWDLLGVVDIITIVLERNGRKFPEENICNYSGLPSPKSYTWEVLPYDRTEKDF